ncbi:MAG: hypothetical protein ABSD78_05285 [Acidimicrobiales bacterium]|jgi:hypothetical protein
MSHLTTVLGSFHGRVLAARLGAEGVLVVLRGATDGPYPIQGTVDVLVPADQLKFAREILLADAVDDAFGGLDLAELTLDGLPDDSATSTMTSQDGSDGDRSPEGTNRSEAFALQAAPHARQRHQARIHGAAAMLVVVVVLVLAVVGVMAAAVH